MKKLFLIIIFFVYLSNIMAQNLENIENKPLWLRMDDAVQKVESGESGDALFLFRKILEDFPGNPESEMWLGFILDQENEYELAVKHLELALEHKKQLVIIEDQYRILYKLADINYKQGNFESYVENLNRIIEYSGEMITNTNLKKVMLDVLKNKGYDKFIELYRPNGKISLKAYGLLGKYYFETENWILSIDYLMYFTGSIINSSIEEIKNIEPNYTFLIENSTDKSLEHIFDLINKHSVIKDYIRYNSFYEYYYYLGKALKKSGYNASGSYILEILYLRPESGKWGFLSNPI